MVGGFGLGMYSVGVSLSEGEYWQALYRAGVSTLGVSVWYRQHGAETNRMLQKVLQNLKLGKSGQSAATGAGQAAGVASGSEVINSINELPANQGYDSFGKLKAAIGSPGAGNHWHHIVEQSQIDKSGFSAQQIHNTSNIIAVDAATHAKITGYYNTKTFKFTGGLSVRDWLAGQSYEYQYEFGLNVLKGYGVIE